MEKGHIKRQGWGQPKANLSFRTNACVTDAGHSSSPSLDFRRVFFTQEQLDSAEK